LSRSEGHTPPPLSRGESLRAQRSYIKKLFQYKPLNLSNPAKVNRHCGINIKTLKS
jgi:hypothetical protein